MEREYPDYEASGEKTDRWPALIWLCLGNFALLLLMAKLLKPSYPGLPTEHFDSAPIFVTVAAIALLSPAKPAGWSGWTRILVFVFSVDALAFLTMFTVAMIISALGMSPLEALLTNLSVGLAGFGAVFAISRIVKRRNVGPDSLNP